MISVFTPDSDPRSWLAGVLDALGCQVGTLHRAADGFLDLIAQIGVPDELLPKITRIPIGKGIAGVAAETRRPVELCNLQEDQGGIARPDACKTKVSGSLAVPIVSPDGETVLGTLGIGKHCEHLFTEDEKCRLISFSAQVAGIWNQSRISNPSK